MFARLNFVDLRLETMHELEDFWRTRVGAYAGMKKGYHQLKPGTGHSLSVVLFDTEALYQEAFGLTVTEGGHAMITLETFLGMVGRPWPISRAVLLDSYGADFPVDELVATCGAISTSSSRPASP